MIFILVYVVDGVVLSQTPEVALNLNVNLHLNYCYYFNSPEMTDVSKANDCRSAVNCKNIIEQRAYYATIPTWIELFAIFTLTFCNAECK